MSNRLTRLRTPVLFACSLALAGSMMADSIGTRSPKGPEDVVEDRRLPLWQTAIKRTKESGHYIAACVQTKMSVFDGEGKLLGTVSEVERVERGGKQLCWRTESKKQTGNPGMTIKADFGLQADPTTVLEGYDEWHLRDKGEMDGRAIEVWEGITKADPANRVVTSLDVESGFPRQAVLSMPFHFPLISQVVKMTLTYAPFQDGIWLPVTSTCDQKGRLLLIKRRILLVKTYSQWEPARP